MIRKDIPGDLLIHIFGNAIDALTSTRWPAAAWSRGTVPVWSHSTMQLHLCLAGFECIELASSALNYQKAFRDLYLIISQE